MPPTSLHCGRLPVAVASLQLSLCQAYRCLLRFHQKSMENLSWRVPGGAQASPEGSRCHFVVPGRLPERPGTLPKAPADAQEPPRGPQGTAHEPPRVARGGPRASKLPKMKQKFMEKTNFYRISWKNVIFSKSWFCLSKTMNSGDVAAPKNVNFHENLHFSQENSEI